MRISLITGLVWTAALWAQDSPAPPWSETTLLERLWLSGQANFIRQEQPSFESKYSGPQSLRADREHATSRVYTMYTGFRLTEHLDILADVEATGGNGLSDTFGVAGFFNVDVVRNPTLGEQPYLARALVHWTVPLSKESVEATPGPFALATSVAVRRIEVYAGKMGTVDFFDNNAIGSDSHFQFLNWAVVNNGAYDYAADTRGYTDGVVVALYDKDRVFRFGEMLMPKVANGIDLEWNVTKAHAENFEAELHPKVFGKRVTTVRPLVFLNHANMGSYREAIEGYLSGKDAKPDVTLYRKQARVKYGFGWNAEQAINDVWRAYGRLGWNEGAHESFAYTEVDRTAAIGTDVAGKRWRRASDKVGAVFVTNAISGDHRRYLALGGLGFILGDGALRYGPERIAEAYYTAHLCPGVAVAFDVQHVNDPGYNRDRGPVWVFGARVHLEGALHLR